MSVTLTKAKMVAKLFPLPFSLPLILMPLSEAQIAGGWQSITNLEDPHVIEIANFAVTQYNQKWKLRFKFQSVIKGKLQNVSGENYRLVLALLDGTLVKHCQAVVYEDLKGVYNHTSFQPVA